METPEFIARAHKLMSTQVREELIQHLAYHPTEGDVVRGTGGIRNLRWKLEGRGKRGGARVVYFFHGMKMPLFLLTVFAKNERVDSSVKERDELRKLTEVLTETYGRRQR